MTTQDTAPTPTPPPGNQPHDSPVIRRDDPLASIRAMAAAHNNWGRWGEDDVLGTLNFIDAAKRIEAAALVKTGEAFSLSQPFDTNGPQKGWRRRTNPVHTMTDTGVDAERGNQGFPHGFGGADDVIAMPLQCSTQWDGLGHIFDQGKAWNGRAAGDVVTSEGDLVTGIETAAAKIVTRGVLLDVGRALGPELGGTTANCRTASPSPRNTSSGPSNRRVPSSKVGRGRHRGDPHRPVHPGPPRRAGATTPAARPRACPSPPHRGCTASEIAGIATDTWGFEVRPNEFDGAFQPLHQIAIPNLGLFLGEMWDPDGLAEACAAGRQVRLPAHRRPASHHGRSGITGQPDRRPVVSPRSGTEHTIAVNAVNTKESTMAAVQNVGIAGAGAAGLAAAILLADAGIHVEVLEKAASPQTLGSGITLQGNALRILRQLGVWDQMEAKGYSFSTLGLRAPDPAGTVIAVLEDIRTGGEDLPATLGMYRPDLTAILRERAEQAGARISYGKTVTE